MTRRSYDTASGSVITSDQGAHLTEWRVDKHPVIWVSRESVFAKGRPIRGGVPVCWPWFGPGRSGELSPSHGFARIAPWRLVAEASDGASVRLTWELTPEEVRGLPGVEHFPHAFTARLEVTVADTATIALTVRNEDDHAFDYEAALHTYLHVGDIGRVSVTGLDGVDYFDKVLQATHTQAGDLVLTGETDRVYTADGPVHVVDAALGRTLTIEKSGSANTVVWNPWADKAQDMDDFADDEWPQMLCVEAASVGAHAIRLGPGAEHTLSTAVRCSPLDQS